MAALSLPLAQQFSKAGSGVRSGAVITTSSDAGKCGKPYITKPAV
jgi:hypothetical protein